MKLEDYDKFYEKAENERALPLPYPNGTERRKINALYMGYQIEYELERLHRYHKELYDDNKKLHEENKYLKGYILDLEIRIECLEQFENLPSINYYKLLKSFDEK